jgi:hypothetical protein
MKSNIEIADECLRMVERVIRNEIPAVTCPEKKIQMAWKKDEVKQILINKLQTPSAVMVGPGELK